MLQQSMEYFAQYDPELGASIQEEFARERRHIELIASENIVSEAVMLAQGSCLTNKYAEGYPGKQYYGGCCAVDVTEELARQRACKLFGCNYANVQPHSGANAYLATFFALLQPGDTVLSMSLAHGSHLSHGTPVNISGVDALCRRFPIYEWLKSRQGRPDGFFMLSRLTVSGFCAICAIYAMREDTTWNTASSRPAVCWSSPILLFSMSGSGGGTKKNSAPRPLTACWLWVF